MSSNMAGAAILLRKSEPRPLVDCQLNYITGIAGQVVNPDAQPVPPLLVQMDNVAL
jgi:hypothetical protein